MTESPDSPASPARTDTWEGLLDALRRRFPGQRDSVLFCIHKLQQNPDLKLPDFRSEANLHGIPVAGRALHSARVLLGLQAAEPKAPKPNLAPAAPEPTADVATRRARRRRSEASQTGETPIEMRVLSAMQELQSAANREADQLRAAIRQAIALLQRAIEH